MRVLRSWLEEFVRELPETDELVTRLDGLGLAVEAVHELPAAPAGVVVAEVVALDDLPGTDGLRVAEVASGADRVRAVCGAPNVAVGMRTAYAPPGARLPDGPVGVREVAGVRSEGMLCSPRELGLFDHAGGLLVLGDDVAVGSALADAWPRDVVLELELTPNRADAFSVLGVARDVAAALGVALRSPLEGIEDLGDPTVDDGLRLEIDDPERCPRFTLRRIDGVRVGPSPVWLQRRLAAAGARPRNVAVDVTNYVTFELGQPSHAYDLRALEGGTMQVRRARPGERLVTLGDDALELDPDDLVIATPDPSGGSRAIGLAGVVGGRDDSVRADTTVVALEVAHFAPGGVRRSARRHRLNTEAHHRFERGVDPNLPPAASARAAALLRDLAGGRVHEGVSTFGGDARRPAVRFRPSRVGTLVGVDVAPVEARRSLERLGCRVDATPEASGGGGTAAAAEAGGGAPEAGGGATAWSVTPPSWRFDLEIEEDLIEEVARLHGYEHIGATLPTMDFVPPPGDPIHWRLREALVGLGLVEAIGYVFAGEEALIAARAPAPSVRLAEPQGEERAVLRTALHPGLLSVARLNRGVDDLSVFEIGRTFDREESERLGIVLRGRRLGAPWRPGVEVDFFVLKGMLEALAETFRAEVTMEPAPVPHLHPGASAAVRWDGRVVGTAGRIHPEVAEALETGVVYLAELELPLPFGVPALAPVPRQPFAERDLAVVVPLATTYAAVRDRAAAAAGPELVSLEPFDVYAGAQLGEGTKSLALRFRFRHAERALTDAEVDARMKDIIRALAEDGYTIRS